VDQDQKERQARLDGWAAVAMQEMIHVFMAKNAGSVRKVVEDKVVADITAAAYIYAKSMERHRQEDIDSRGPEGALT
jgi:hypothetical protein